MTSATGFVKTIPPILPLPQIKTEQRQDEIKQGENYCQFGGAGPPRTPPLHRELAPAPPERRGDSGLKLGGGGSLGDSPKSPPRPSAGCGGRRGAGGAHAQPVTPLSRHVRVLCPGNGWGGLEWGPWCQQSQNGGDGIQLPLRHWEQRWWCEPPQNALISPQIFCPPPKKNLQGSSPGSEQDPPRGSPSLPATLP